MPETFEKELPESTYPEIIRSNLSSVVRLPCWSGCVVVLQKYSIELLHVERKKHIKGPSHQCHRKSERDLKIFEMI